MSKSTPKNKIFVVVVAVSIGLICLLQGGYFALPVFIISAALCFVYFVMSIFGSVKPKFSVVALLLLALSVIYCASATINSMNLTAFICACMPAALAIFSLSFASFAGKKSQLLYNIIALLGVAIAVVAIGGFFALSNVEQFCMSSRLVFPMGYSNASAIFFMIVAVLCIVLLRGKLKYLVIIPVVALVLTKSVGAIAISALVALIIWVYWLKNYQTEKRFKIISALLVLVCIVLFVILAIIWKDRIVEASQTFIERYIQIFDGFTLLAGSPLVGIGPDQWQYLYPATQTAQYTASKIHCSYMQILPDGGIVAAGIVLAGIIYAYVRLIKHKANVSVLLISAVLVHAMIDFDFSFPIICVLLIMLVECPLRACLKEDKIEIEICELYRQNNNKIIPLTCCIICCVISFIGFFFQIQMNGVVNSASNADKSLTNASTSNTLIANDSKANTYIMSGLVNGKKFNDACNYSQKLDNKTTSCVVLTIRAIAGSGNPDQAVEYMHAALDAQPYNADLYSMVHDLLQNNDFNQAYKDAYNYCAMQAIEKFDVGNSALLENHKYPDLF